MRVRRTLSESETEKYARPGQLLLDRAAVWKVNKMPIAILSTLALSVAVSLWRTQIRTHGAEVQEARESNGPEVLGVDNVTTIKLGEELELDT